MTVLPGIVTLNGQSYLLINDDDGGANSAGIRGSARKQDWTPSTRDVVEGIPGDTDLPTSSIIGYGDAAGSFGLSDRILAPGDLSRPFLSELDNTRPRQLTAWVGNTADTSLSGRLLNTGFVSLESLVDAATGFGFTALSASGTRDFWQWSSGANAYAFVRAGYGFAAATTIPGYTSRATLGGATIAYPRQIVVDYAGGLWMSGAGGLINLAVAAAALVGDPNTAMTVKYLDMLWSFGMTTGGITITPYRFAAGSTPATAGAQVQKVDTDITHATYGQTINSTVTISGEYAINGVVAGESNIFLVTDRSIYRIGWTDGLNVFDFTRLPVEVPAFTSAPVWWNGELWIGAGNQIIHIVPGQRTYDTVLVDEIGRMPAPFNGRIQQLMASSQYLIAQIVEDFTTTPTNMTIAMRDVNGAWHTRALVLGGTAGPFAARNPLLQKLDANGFAVATLTNVAGGVSTTHQYPIVGAGKNPINMPTSIRTQEGIQRIIFPWETGQVESSLKQLLRNRLQVIGVGAQTAATHVKAYFQLDTMDNTPSWSGDTIFAGGLAFNTVLWGGIAVGTSGWVVAADAYQGAIGDYGSKISSKGNGFIWTEYDAHVFAMGCTVVAGQITAVTGATGTFTGTPTLIFVTPPGVGGSGATATANMSGGNIASVTVNAPGSGYVTSNVNCLAVGGYTVNGLPSGSPWGYSPSMLPDGILGISGAYPQWRRIRWMIEVGGDATGTIVPAAVALVWEFYEYPKVGYQYTIRLRMRVGDTHIVSGTKPDGSAKSKYDTPAAIIADRDALENLKNNRTPTPYADVDTHTWGVIVTKVTHDTISMDATGIQESETELTLTVVPLFGAV